MTTSALMVGLPLLLSMEGEAGLVAQEKEYLGQQVSHSSLGEGAKGADGSLVVC